MPSVNGSRSLYLLRHAKSSWDQPGVADHDRPLAPRGRRAVDGLAEYIEHHGVRPELVLCSSARRTRETLEGIHPTGERIIDTALYTANCTGLFDRLRGLSDDVSSVMVIGHNPALQMLALRLAGSVGSTAGDHLAEITRKFPTGALATLSLPGAWSDLSPGGAVLVDYVRATALLYS